MLEKRGSIELLFLPAFFKNYIQMFKTVTVNIENYVNSFYCFFITGTQMFTHFQLTFSRKRK